MKHLIRTLPRRLGAWALCLLLAAGQLALPAAALAQDLSGLPTLTLYYWLAEDNQQALQVFPSLNGTQPVYWATLPEAAFTGEFPVTMDITPAITDPNQSYAPVNGTQLVPMNAIDFNTPSQHITPLTPEGEVAGPGYDVYLSTIPIPQVEVPPVLVSVRYVENGEPVYSTEVLCTFGAPTPIAADRSVLPEGYTVVGTDYYEVHVDENGTASPSEVVFQVEGPQPVSQNGWVTIHYVGLNGMDLIDPLSQELTPGDHSIPFEEGRVPEGYKAGPDTPSSIPVKVATDGTTSPADVYFDLMEAQETEPPAPETDPPAPETDPPAPETDPPQQEVTPIGRNGLTNGTVNFRGDPSKNNNPVVSNAPKNTAVYVEGQLTANGETWYQITYEGTLCYVVKSYVDLLGSITIRYTDGDGVDIATAQEKALPPGQHTITPEQSLIPQGYTLTSAGSVDVTINEDGSASQDTVTFAYQRDTVSAQVVVRYMDANDQEIAAQQTLTLPEGSTPVMPGEGLVPQGYTLTSAGSVEVTVSADGSASPNPVIFRYQKDINKPVLDILYQDDSGSTFATATTQPLEVGQTTITPEESLVPQGYTLTSAKSVTVTVDESGVPSPSQVVFTYQRPAVSGSLTVAYQDEKGADIAPAQTKELSKGTHSILPEATIPQGYTLTSLASVDVTVDDSGKVTPATVTFTYKKEVNKPTVDILYRDTTGVTFATATSQPLDIGPNAITPDSSLVPAGYTITSPASVAVTVDDSGKASPTQVEFLYQKPADSAKITISYIDVATNKSIVPIQEKTLQNGSYPITPEDNLVPVGYVLDESSSPQVQVTVANGTASPDSVTFRYKQQVEEVYMGYALTTTQTALRSQYNQEDSSIIKMLPKDTLLYINGQRTVSGTKWSGAIQWLDKAKPSGVVLDSTIKQISNKEAEALIKAYTDQNATPTPSPTPTPTKVPSQLSGYYITIGSNVPLRNLTNVYSEAKAWLPIDTVVYVSGQLYNEGYGWHISNYSGVTGYIRDDQLRKMNDAEVQAYLASLKTPTPTPAATPAPYDPNAKSSYGYVTANSVNFRQTPNGTKIKALNQYAMALVYGSQVQGGYTWYNVNQGGTIGWIRSDFLHVMSLSEFSSFLNSSQYYQGIANNGTGTSTGTGGNTSGNTGGGTTGGTTSGGTSGSSGTASQGNVSSVEDWNVGAWQNTGAGTALSPSYDPFDPYSTPSASTSPGPSASASVEPTSSFAIGTMIPITYDDESKETQTDSFPWGLLGAGVILVGGAGGVYAYALNQNKKRKAAAKAAAAKRAAAGAGGAAAAGNQSPYTRRAVAAPPTTGSSTQQRPGVPTAKAPGTPSSQTPYTRPAAGPTSSTQSSAGVFAPPLGATGAQQNPYARPAGQQPGAGSASLGSIPGNTGTPAASPGTEAPSSGAAPASQGGAAFGAGMNVAGSLHQQPNQPTPGATPAGSSNPYVQPLSDENAHTSGDRPATRRTSRTQRYQNAEKNDEGNKS